MSKPTSKPTNATWPFRSAEFRVGVILGLGVATLLCTWLLTKYPSTHDNSVPMLTGIVLGTYLTVEAARQTVATSRQATQQDE